MYDQSTAATAMYRTTEVSSSSPLAQVVLLYQGAIRFGSLHLGALERGDPEAAHNASIRCQAIVAGLRETLDLSAGPIAGQLDQLYDFVLRRLTEGNIAKTPRPTEEALEVLRGLLGAWREIARKPAAGSAPARDERPAPAVLGATVPSSHSFAGGPPR
jgi:flagellar protein FliS